MNLDAQSLYDAEGFEETFEIDPFVRKRLLEGLDEIGATLQIGDQISEFEKHRPGYLTPAAS